jgi:anti-sigma factor RsiW
MNRNFRSLRYQAPEDLKTDLQDLVESSNRKIVFNIQIGNWLGVAAAAVAVVVVASSLLWSRGPNLEDGLRHELVSSHVRSMMENHLFDVASTDSHTVKPWFNGRIDFAPQVTDLKDVGFPLVGGRLDYIGNRAVAALVYKKDRHVINVFVWPDSREQGEPVFTAYQGYHIWQWHQDGMAMAAVSDLNANSLREFVDHLKGSR